MLFTSWLTRRISALQLRNLLREKLMKKQILHAVAALFLVMLAAPLFAVQRNVVDEVIRMTKSGVPEDTILEYVDKTDIRIAVTGDDVIAMTDANVPKAVVKAVVDASQASRASNYNDRRYSTRVLVSPSYYSPYYYNYYDPFWYRPSLYLGFGFGGYYGGGFRGGHYGGGGHRGHR
ncbi:MAG: hypothetical protein QOC81_2815 [Thermoanaerobaculia bacterium]|jgi:hypothetical protein|nr:hypothetical protein [Thermoanaerobaculia bacterium]